MGFYLNKQQPLLLRFLLLSNNKDEILRGLRSRRGARARCGALRWGGKDVSEVLISLRVFNGLPDQQSYPSLLCMHVELPHGREWTRSSNETNSTNGRSKTLERNETSKTIGGLENMEWNETSNTNGGSKTLERNETSKTIGGLENMESNETSNTNGGSKTLERNETSKTIGGLETMEASR